MLERLDAEVLALAQQVATLRAAGADVEAAPTTEEARELILKALYGPPERKALDPFERDLMRVLGVDSAMMRVKGR